MQNRLCRVLRSFLYRSRRKTRFGGSSEKNRRDRLNAPSGDRLGGAKSMILGVRHFSEHRRVLKNGLTCRHDGLIFYWITRCSFSTLPSARRIQHYRRSHQNALTHTRKTRSCIENKNNVQLHPNSEIFQNHSFVRSESEMCTRGVRDSLRVARNTWLRLKILLTIRFDTCIRCEKTKTKLITSAQLHTDRKNDVNTKTVKTHATRWQRITVGLGSFQ